MNGISSMMAVFFIVVVIIMLLVFVKFAGIIPQTGGTLLDKIINCFNNPGRCMSGAEQQKEAPAGG